MGLEYTRSIGRRKEGVYRGEEGRVGLVYTKSIGRRKDGLQRLEEGRWV